MGNGYLYIFHCSYHLIKIYGSTHVARVAFLLCKSFIPADNAKTTTYRLATPSAQAHVARPLEGAGVERGVENRERARFFALYIIICKKSERFSERKFLAGKFSRPREAPAPRGAWRGDRNILQRPPHYIYILITTPREADDYTLTLRKTPCELHGVIYRVR